MTLQINYQVTAFGDRHQPMLTHPPRNREEVLRRVDDLLLAGYQVLITQQSVPVERAEVAGDPRGEADR